MNGGMWSNPTGAKRRIMVVADPGREAAGALEWALSHAVLEQDEIILLHVGPHAVRRSTSATFSAFLRRPAHPTMMQPSVSLPTHAHAPAHAAAADGGKHEHEFLDAMKTKCEAAQPKVRVHIERVEMQNKDKAAAILAQTKVLSIDLLVVGQRRNSGAFMGCKLSGSMSSKGPDIAEILIEDSRCICVGVQKKNQNAGYLLNTKTHKNFWLLA